MCKSVSGFYIAGLGIFGPVAYGRSKLVSFLKMPYPLLMKDMCISNGKNTYAAKKNLSNPRPWPVYCIDTWSNQLFTVIISC